MRSAFLSTCLLLSVMCSSLAVAVDGAWIDLFDGDTLFGWTPIGEADWGVRDGEIVCPKGSGGMLATTTSFRDFELSAKVRIKADCSTGIAFRAALDGHPTENGSSVLWLSEKKGSESPWRDVRIIANGGDVTVTVDGNAADFHAGSSASGRIALLYHHNNNARLWVKDVRLRPLALTPIFDGKTLNGWNIIPGHKSKFNVVDGAINITNGNGQIETAGTYKNFLLQLDIISNGDHLNSGVFFRGPVGVFWKGYESQVRNQYARDDRTKPIDFGTGGNYGNQPARKVVPNDYEWFNKTVIADNNHMAVWINGYQVSDFLDTRPVSPDANGKAGYVNTAGTIHLQGHDPTTNLSFKNIRIQGYTD